MDGEVAKIAAACDCLDAERPEEALEVFEEVEGPRSRVYESLALAARGMIFERDGRLDDAERCFRRVLAHGVPLAPLLRASGRFFKRGGRHDESYACYSLLDQIAPGAIGEFLAGLPEPQVYRYSPWLIGDLLSRPKPELYALSPVKDALVSWLGTKPAAATYAGMARLDAGWDLERMPITSLKEFACERELDYEEILPEREVRVPPAPRFGVAEASSGVASTRTVFSCVLHDCIVSSKSNFFLTGGTALLDYQHDELEKAPIDLGIDAIVFGPEGDEATFLIAAGALAGEPLPRALSLVGFNSFNFGHLLLEFLPKLLAFLGRPGFASIPILIDEQMPWQHREAIELFSEPGQPIVVLRRGAAVRVDELWTCSIVTNVSLAPRDDSHGSVPLMVIDGEGFAGLIGKVESRLAAIEPAPRKRIYLARSDRQHRRLANRSEVEEWFAARGFEILRLSEFSFAEQVGLARGADVIVGPDGSDLWISFLAGQGTRIGILNNPYLEEHTGTPRRASTSASGC